METFFILDNKIRFSPASNELQFLRNNPSEMYEAVKVENRLSRVLYEMLKKPNQVIHRADFVSMIWEGNTNVGNPALTKAVSNLRSILKKNLPGSEAIIETIPKVGYRLRIEKKAANTRFRQQRFWPNAPAVIQVNGMHLAILLAVLFLILKLGANGAFHSIGHQLGH